MNARREGEPRPAAARGRFRPVVSVSIGLLAVLAAPPASADWLVLHDGSTVETAGRWQVEGRLVVFESPGRRLVSLRLDDVLLPASEEASAMARAALDAPPTVAPPPPRQKARVVLTDADIPRARPKSNAPEAEQARGAVEAPAGGAAAGASDAVVLSWESVDSPAGDGLQIYGTVQNQGRRTLTGTGMRVLLYDRDGLLITRAEAQLTRPELPSQALSNFTVAFPGVFAYAGVKFDLRYGGA